MDTVFGKRNYFISLNSTLATIIQDNIKTNLVSMPNTGLLGSFYKLTALVKGLQTLFAKYASKERVINAIYKLL